MTTTGKPNQRHLLTMLNADLSCRDLRPSTVKNYCRQVEPLLERFEDVVSLSRDEIIDWIHECDTKSKQRFRWLGVKSLFRMLLADGLVAKDPTEGIKTPREQVRPQQYISDGDLQRLLATCGKDFTGIRDRAIMAVLDSTGCRRGELVALNNGDLDLAEGKVLIRTSKTGFGRHAYLDAIAIKALALWFRHRDRTVHNEGVDAPPAPVWAQRNGRRLGSDGVRQMLERRGAKCGVNTSAHEFRRRYAVRWHKAGGSPLGLQTSGGWTSSAMPARYAAVAAEEIARIDHRRIFDKRQSNGDS